MLIKYYVPSEHLVLNHDETCPGCPDCYQSSDRNLRFQASPPTTIFENLPPTTVSKMLDEQFNAAKEEAHLLRKHSMLTESSEKKTLQQYERYFFHKGHAYLKDEIRTLVATQESPQATQAYLESPDLPNDNPQDRRPTVYVSKEAIRSITGFTTTPIPEWSITRQPVRIKWQEDLLDDEEEFVTIDGSRQMGKSMTIAEKLIEESFLPNNDSLVGAFTSKSTGAIRRYFKKLTRKFPEGTFVENKKDEYVENSKTLTKVFFRTLADDAADSSRGLTLKNVVVDEAQLVSDFVYEDVLEPMTATTGGRMILIGTAGRKRSGYFFELMTRIRKKQQKGSYYRISIDDNPMIHPRVRERVTNTKDKPHIQREYYNVWGDAGDGLFDIPKCQQLPPINPEDDFFVLGIDPARLNDRSGNSLLHVSNGKITILQSGFVPDSHKKDWGLQAKWYLSQLVKPYQSKHLKFRPNSNEWPSDKWYDVMDVSGVGDGAAHVFRSEGMKIHANIRYTAGLAESDDGLNYKVGKTVLINTFLDLCQEGLVQMYEPTNQYLAEELSYAERDETKAGQILMKSAFFDDVINATLIAAYFVVKRRLLGRTKSHNPDANPDDSPFQRHDHMEAIERSREMMRKPSRSW